MDQLIPLAQGDDGKTLVNLRDLHSFLGVKSDFTTWVKRRIKTYNFKEGRDYVSSQVKNVGIEAKNSYIQEYNATISMAKQLTMVENNDRGQQAREYFIRVEEGFKSIVAPLGTTAEALLQNISSLHSAVTLIAEQEKRIQALEARAKLQEDIRAQIASLPKAKEEAPIVATRSYLVKLISMHSIANDVTYSTAWGHFYKEFEMAAHIRLPKENRLDIIEERGLMEKAYAFAQKLYPENNKAI